MAFFIRQVKHTPQELTTKRFKCLATIFCLIFKTTLILMSVYKTTTGMLSSL